LDRGANSQGMACGHGRPRAFLGCRRAESSQSCYSYGAGAITGSFFERSTAMEPVDRSGSARGFQVMVAMRDGIRLNTFAFLPASGGPRWPVILHRTPYGIAASDAEDKTDCNRAWMPSAAEPFRGSILRGWRHITRHGYVAVYQD